MKIGVLAIQGDVREHQRHLTALGCEVPLVRRVADLDGVEGLVMPGGESTAIGLLMQEEGLLDELRARIARGFPVYGTCAGLILLARDIEGPPPPRVGAMDITANRNAYGRQLASFEAALDIPAVGETPFVAVFIRAPRIARMGPGVVPLAFLDKEPVMAEQGPLLVSAFHPELTGDNRVHRYFVEKVRTAHYRPAS